MEIYWHLILDPIGKNRVEEINSVAPYDDVTAAVIKCRGKNKVKDDFNEFFQTDERRIYYQMQRLMIPRDLYEVFYAEVILALWNAYISNDVEKGEIGTFINYQIRFRLMDLIRKKARHQEILELTVHEAIVQIDDGNRYSRT